VEELLELLQAEQDALQSDDSDDDLLMSISKLAVSGATTSSTIRLVGMIRDQEVLILVDSGSSHCFISEGVVEKLKLATTTIPPARVKIASGGIMTCDKQLADCAWWTQGYSFNTDLRVLALGCYDMVLGMDWLEEMGDMKVSWKRKTMQFQYKGQSVFLRGIPPTPPVLECAPVTLAQLQAMEKVGSILHMVAIFSAEDGDSTQTYAPAVQRLIKDFAEVFAEPTTLPPARDWDHTIPLVAGAIQLQQDSTAIHQHKKQRSKHKSLLCCVRDSSNQVPALSRHQSFSCVKRICHGVSVSIIDCSIPSQSRISTRSR
jgi:hypothetical protein